MADTSEQPTARFDVHVTSDSHFGWIRTRLAVERTLMAYLRTGVALIGFGFTIVQFFQRLQAMGPKEDQLHPGAPRDLGLALIAAGLGCLVVASLQYRRGLGYLWSPQFRGIAGMDSTAHRTPAMFAAGVLMFIGLAALVSVFVKFP